MSTRLSRREIMAAMGLGLGIAHGGNRGGRTPKPVRFSNIDQIIVKAPSFRYCFNTATIMGQKLPLEKEAEIAAKAGYQGFEPWVRKIEEYQKKGGSLADMKKRIADLGLSVEDAIGFADWINDDEASARPAWSR